VNRANALMSAATADRAMAFAVAGGVLLVIILLARTVGRLSKLARVAAAPVAPPKSSGGHGKLLLLAGAIGAGVWAYVKTRHPVAAAKAAPAPSPSPTPRPAVTRTVAPHVTQAAGHLLTVSGNVVVMYAIGAVVAIVVIGWVMRRMT
jgi:hypothetical protein